MATGGFQNVHDLDGQKFIQIADIESYFTCNICMSTFDGSAITPCGHRFCLHCITNCLERSPECPICKQYIHHNRLVIDRQHDSLIADIREKSKNVVPDNQTETTNQASVNQVTDPIDINLSVFLDHLNTKDQRLNDVTERLISIKSEEVTRHKDEVRRLAVEFNNTNTALQTANGEVKRLKEGLLKSTSDFNERIRALEETNDEIQRENETLHDEVETLKKELQEATSNFEDLQDTNIALTDENISNKNKLDALEQEQFTTVTDLNNKLAVLETINQQLYVEKKNANGNVTGLQEALEKRNGDLQKLVASYNTLQAENEAINNEKQQLYQQVNDRFGQYMEELRQQVQFSVDEIKTSLELEYEQRIKAANESHRVNLLEKERQVEILKRQIQDQNDTADDLQQATQSYKNIIKEVSDLKDKLQRTKKEKAYFQEQLLFASRTAMSGGVGQLTYDHENAMGRVKNGSRSPDIPSTWKISETNVLKRRKRQTLPDLVNDGWSQWRTLFVHKSEWRWNRINISAILPSLCTKTVRFCCVGIRVRQVRNEDRLVVVSFVMNMKVFLILIVLYYRNDVLSASVSSCSDWSNWSNCSKTCGIGVQSRNRTCDGTTMDSKTWCRNAGETDNSSHNFSSCTVHSDWSQWTTWPSCSVECGNSTKTRSRQCNSTEQAHGGSYWQCQNISKVKCIITQCPVNGGWSDWSSWSNCSVTCGNGTMTNSRECNSPIPKRGGNDCQGENVSTKSCEETLCPDSYSLKTNSDSREKFTIFSTLHLTTYASDSQIGLPTLTMNTHLTSLPLLSSGSEVKKKYMLSDTQMTSKTEDIGSEDTLYSYQVASDMFPSISISSSASHQTKTNSYDRHRESLSLFLTSTKVSDSYPLDAYSTYEIMKSEYLSSISAKPTCADVFHISSSISQAKKISASLTTDSLPLSPTSTKPLSYLLLPSENGETFLDMGIVTTMSTKKLSMTQESISSGPVFPATKTPSSLLGQIPNNIHEPSDTTAHWQGTSIRKDTYVYNISPTQTMQGNTILDNSVYSSKMETSRSIERTNALTTPHTESSTGSEDTTYKNNTTSDVPMYKWLLIGSLGLLLPLCSIIGTLIYCCARYNVTPTDKDSDIKKPCHVSETWYDNALFNDKSGQMPQHYDRQYRKGIINTQITKSLGQTYDHRLDIVNNDSNTKSGSHSSTETVDLQRSSSTKARKKESMLIPNYQIKKISTANISKKVVSIKRNSEVLDPTNLDRSQQPHLMVPRQYKHTRAQKVETYLYEEESGVLVPYGYMESNVPIPDYEDTSVVPLPDYQIGIYYDKD